MGCVQHKNHARTADPPCFFLTPSQLFSGELQGKVDMQVRRGGGERKCFWKKQEESTSLSFLIPSWSVWLLVSSQPLVTSRKLKWGGGWLVESSSGGGDTCKLPSFQWCDITSSGNQGQTWSYWWCSRISLKVCGLRQPLCLEVHESPKTSESKMAAGVCVCEGKLERSVTISILHRQVVGSNPVS